MKPFKFDVAAQKVIAQQKVLRHGIYFVELFVGKGFLWAATDDDYFKNDEKDEISLYHVEGLEPYIESRHTEKTGEGQAKLPKPSTTMKHIKIRSRIYARVYRCFSRPKR
jgi:hypothetical protein